jgi:hypothetical protein
MPTLRPALLLLFPLIIAPLAAQTAAPPTKWPPNSLDRPRPPAIDPGPSGAPGLVGPYLVLLHSAFRFRGLAGVLSLVTLVVVLSGIAGRYWYTASAAGSPNPRKALWYVLHVPLSAAIAVLAVLHVIGVLYYAAGLR